MANDAQHRAEPAFKAENEADLLLGRANPNPDRVGCPPREALIALARRQVPVGDRIGDHVASCSPCYREMRAIQQAEGIRPADERAVWRTWWPAAAAALLVAAGVAGWFVFAGRQRAPAPEQPSVVAVALPIDVELDLRKYGVTRSDQPASDLPPLVLPRAHVNVTLLLPTGSEPGEYEVRVVRPDGQVLASASGRAEIREFVVTLGVSLDLRGLAPGRHRLAVRRDGEERQEFALEVR